MSDRQSDVDRKVATILHELAGSRAEQLLGPRGAQHGQAKIAEATRDEYPEPLARDIAFHLTDWIAEAGFLVALCLYPERFSADEVKCGLMNLLVHAPNHIAAAAKLAGHPIQDVFGLGDLMEP